MYRRRPSIHYRIVKTRRGQKRILINPEVRRVRIKPKERIVFNQISDPRKHKAEFGGGLDFNKKGDLENINVVPGSKYEVSLPPDYEVQYHTHPDINTSPPTPEDIQALLKNKNQQAEVVFRDGKAFTVVKTISTRALSKLPATQIKTKLDKAFYSSRGPNWENKWKKNLEELGFIVYLNNEPSKKLDLEIKVVEPRGKKR